MPRYILDNSVYICHLDTKNGGRQVTVSVSCIVQPLWQCQVRIEATDLYLSFRFKKNGGRQVTEKPFTSK